MGVTNIEWCDFTFNCWRGCTKVSAGCANCYAETLSNRNPGTLGVWGPKGTRVVASEAMWKQPLNWDRKAKEAGVRPRVFCASLADVFEDWTGPMVNSAGEKLDHSGVWQFIGNPAYDPLVMSSVRVRLGNLINDTPNLDWLVLTKRPENVLNMMEDHMFGVLDNGSIAIPDNLWIGTSVEDQATADERIPHLLQVPAAVRFLSMEPLLGPVDLLRVDAAGFGGQQGHKIDCMRKGYWSGGPLGFVNHSDLHEKFKSLDWVIVGGESGPDARPMRMEWARSIIDQCKAADVPVFMKQIGEFPTTTLPDGESWPGHSGPSSDVQFSGDGFGNYHVTGLKDKKGGDPTEWPAAFRVRQFPKE